MDLDGWMFYLSNVEVCYSLAFATTYLQYPRDLIGVNMLSHKHSLEYNDTTSKL